MQFELKNGCSWTLHQKRHKINSRSFCLCAALMSLIRYTHNVGLLKGD